MNPENTLAESKQYLKDGWEKGVDCPCCGQLVKLYERKLNSAMAYGLILMANSDKEWIHTEDFFKALEGVPSSIRGDISKLRYWGLLEQMKGYRDDGSNRIGYYRVTQKGKDFVTGKLQVPSRVKLFNQGFYGYTGQDIDIKKALGDSFNYAELMGESYIELSPPKALSWLKDEPTT